MIFAVILHISTYSCPIYAVVTVPCVAQTIV